MASYPVSCLSSLHIILLYCIILIILIKHLLLLHNSCETSLFAFCIFYYCTVYFVCQVIGSENCLLNDFNSVRLNLLFVVLFLMLLVFCFYWQLMDILFLSSVLWQSSAQSVVFANNASTTHNFITLLHSQKCNILNYLTLYRFIVLKVLLNPVQSVSLESVIHYWLTDGCIMVCTCYSYYLSHNIWVNIYTVDSKWLYSLYWCMNVTSITTNVCHEFSQMNSPVWHMVSICRIFLFHYSMHF